MENMPEAPATKPELTDEEKAEQKRTWAVFKALHDVLSSVKTLDASAAVSLVSGSVWVAIEKENQTRKFSALPVDIDDEIALKVMEVVKDEPINDVLKYLSAFGNGVELHQRKKLEESGQTVADLEFVFPEA